MALVNRVALVEYDVPGPVVIHERAVLAHLSGDEYAILTPDGDVYIEEMSVTNSDLRSFRIRPAPGVRPPGVNAAQVYGLPVYSPAQMAGFRAEAQRVVTAEQAARGGAGVVAIAGPLVAPNNAGALVGPNRTPGVLQWLAAETRGGYRFGDPVPGVAAVAAEDGRSVHVLQDGSSIFVQCVDGGKNPKP